MPSVLFFTFGRFQFELMLFILFTFFMSAAFPHNSVLVVFCFQSLLCFGTRSGRVDLTADNALHPLGIDMPFLLSVCVDRRAEMQPVPVGKRSLNS